MIRRIVAYVQEHQEDDHLASPNHKDKADNPWVEKTKKCALL